MTFGAVLIVPMRNWNWANCGQEEIIPRSVLIVPMRNWNQERLARFLFNPFGSDRTYEELKHINLRRLYNKSRVLIVPMRNWNTVAYPDKVPAAVAFWSYLWGIETYSWNQTADHSLEFWSYLWGIETDLMSPNHDFPFRFWSYLWGIETSSHSRPPPSAVLEFWSYLWGIETTLRSFVEFGKPPFWSYLWGIETPPADRFSSPLQSSDRTYEELKPAPCTWVVTRAA